MSSQGPKLDTIKATNSVREKILTLQNLLELVSRHFYIHVEFAKVD